MISMPWLTTVVTLGLFWLVITQGLALEMAAALLVFLMEKQHFVNVSLCTVNPCMLYIIDFFIVYPPFLVPIVTCVLPPPPLNGTLLTNANESSVITFQCDPGFSLVGTETATCNNSGLWDPYPVLLECKFSMYYVSLNDCMYAAY